MRVLITGASGFVGSHVLQNLLKGQFEVRALARSEAARDELANWGVEVVYGDLATGVGLEDACDGVDVVFHVGAMYSLERRHETAMYEVNVFGTRRLLQAIMRTSSIQRLVYTSSTATVGLLPNGKPSDESVEVDPHDALPGYKRSKVLAEREVRAAIRQGLDAVIVNPSTPIGSGDIKPTPTGMMIRDAVLGRMPAYVDTGLNWVAVSDVAAGHLLALEKGKCGERYILGNVNMTFRELLERIAGLCEVPAPRVRLPLSVALGAAYLDELVLSRISGRAPRAPIAGVKLARHPMFYSSALAVKELGLPQTPIDVALREAIEWFTAAARRR